MEDMLLRLFVIVAAGLQLLKEQTVIQEYDDDITMRESLLEMERNTLEQDLHSVAKQLPHPNQEASQNHQEHPSSEEIYIKQKLSSENSSPNQPPEMLKMDLSDSQPEKTSLKTVSHVQRPSDKDAVLSDIFKDEQELHSHRATQASLSQDLCDGNLSHVGQQESKTEQLSKVDMKSIVQDENPLKAQEVFELSLEPQTDDLQDHNLSLGNQLIGDHVQTDKTQQQEALLITQPDAKIPGINKGPSREHQKPTLMDSKTSPSSQTPNHAVHRQLPGDTEDTYIWYLWNAYSLISVVRLLRRFLKRDSKSSNLPDDDARRKALSGALDIVSEKSLPDQKAVSCFYERCVRIPPDESWRACEFVEGFMDDLLEAVRSTSDKETDMEVEDFIGVGSLYEGWATGKKLVCDLHVPLNPPHPYSLLCEVWDGAGKPSQFDLHGCGRIKLVKGGRSQNGSCPCSNGGLDNDDLVCLLHPHDEKDSTISDATDGPFCSVGTTYLAKGEVTRWFREAIGKAWDEISHKYEFDLMFRNRDAPGALKVRFRSGKTMSFNITPVVRVKDSDIHLLSYCPVGGPNLPDTLWTLSFASYEGTALKHHSKNLPEHSCHIQCLQILSFLHKQQTALTGKCALSSYHLKTILLNLLLVKKHFEWQPEQFANRLRDMLSFLQQTLQRKVLTYASLNHVGLSAELMDTKLINCFQHLKVHDELYIRTVHHFKEMVRNTPVLIHEYTSNKMGGSLHSGM